MSIASVGRSRGPSEESSYGPGATMKRTSRRALIFIGLTCTASLLACTQQSTGIDRVPVVQFLDDSASVAIGGSVEVGLLPMLPPGYVPEVTWSSSDLATATVAAQGRTSALITGVGIGRAVISASGEGATDSVIVTVH